jgi:transposase
VTLLLLWQEYKGEHPDGYQYAQFCLLYRKWAGAIDPVMRQQHKAGEKLFIDYAGQTIWVKDSTDGTLREAQLFLAVLGASNYTYAEATWTQSLPDWIGSHVRAFQFLGGLPELLVPDNLKTGVKSPCRYEPEINPTYQSLADHYQVSVLPARVRKPRDKAKAENGVLQAERWILAPLRNRTFFDLSELNEAIEEKLTELNHRPFSKLSGSRASFFEELERPALRPLPESEFEYAEWIRVSVGPDYHVEADGHYYSVPCKLLRQKIDIRVTQHTVECFHKGVRVSSHRRSGEKGKSSTVREHMPISHQRYLEWTPEKILLSAQRIGPDVARMVEAMIGGGEHPQLSLRSCLGILRLARDYGDPRLNAACRRALSMQALSYKSVRSILRTGLDKVPVAEPGGDLPPIYHENVRGPGYFN